MAEEEPEGPAHSSNPTRSAGELDKDVDLDDYVSIDHEDIQTTPEEEHDRREVRLFIDNRIIIDKREIHTDDYREAEVTDSEVEKLQTDEAPDETEDSLLVRSVRYIEGVILEYGPDYLFTNGMVVIVVVI